VQKSAQYAVLAIEFHELLAKIATFDSNWLFLG
jgi:hypothetical protein